MKAFKKIVLAGRFGAILIGTELILKSRWVLPENISKSGYTFKLPTLKESVTHILDS